MPIDYANYPDSWKIIRKSVLRRAQHRCEHCGAENYEPHPETGSRVVLTVSHTDHNIQNNDLDNLRALCQRCHLRHDARMHAAHAADVIPAQAGTHRLRKELLRKLAGQLGIPWD